MRIYELTIVVSSKVNEKEKTTFLEKIKNLIEKSKGKIDSFKEWGKRTLAYPIKKEKEGVYFFWEIKIDEAKIQDLDRALKLNEAVLRYLIIKKEEKKQSTKSKRQESVKRDKKSNK